MLKTQDIRIRDPFIVVYNGAYYMYRSENNSIWVHKSSNLSDWEEATKVYTLSDDSWGCADLWAPEVHFYRGKFYMFLSLLGKNGLRGTEISVSDTPDEMFIPVSNMPATPSDKSCIDGSLYVEDGVPYIVYSADWPHNYDPKSDSYIGAIWAMQLSVDLCSSAGEPFLLFKSNQAICSKEPNLCKLDGKDVVRFGSDAPFVQRLSNGVLYLTWSPMPKDTYIVAAAISESGKIKGPWKHLDKPLFSENGGHAMFFDALDGSRKMCIHHPERWGDERALFLNIKEENKKLIII